MSDHQKVVTIQVTANDERDLATFVEDVRRGVKSSRTAKVKRVTVLSQHYLIDGKPVRPDGTSILDGRKVEVSEEATPAGYVAPDDPGESAKPKPKAGLGNYTKSRLSIKKEH